MSAANKKKCLKFYPKVWDFDMIVKACEVGKITPEEFFEITGEEYSGEPYIPVSEYAALENQLTDTQMALCEQYEANLALQDEVTNTQLALCEVYELMA